MHASVTNWAQAQKVGNPQFGNVTGLQTVADRMAASGASDKTQRMADKVAKSDTGCVSAHDTAMRRSIASSDCSAGAAIDTSSDLGTDASRGLIRISLASCSITIS